MAALYRRVQDPTACTAGFKTPRDEVPDVGAYSKLYVQFRRLKDGNVAGTYLRLQHSTLNEDASFKDVPGCEIALDNFGDNNLILVVNDFARFIRLIVVGTPGGTPIVGVDFVAKE